MLGQCSTRFRSACKGWSPSRPKELVLSGWHGWPEQEADFVSPSPLPWDGGSPAKVSILLCRPLVVKGFSHDLGLCGKSDLSSITQPLVHEVFTCPVNHLWGLPNYSPWYQAANCQQIATSTTCQVPMCVCVSSLFITEGKKHLTP